MRSVDRHECFRRAQRGHRAQHSTRSWIADRDRRGAVHPFTVDVGGLAQQRRLRPASSVPVRTRHLQQPKLTPASRRHRSRIARSRGQILIGDRQRNEHANGLAVHTTTDAQQTLLQGGGERIFFTIAPSGSLPPRVFTTSKPTIAPTPRRFAIGVPELAAISGSIAARMRLPMSCRALEQVVFPNHIEHGQRCRTGERMSRHDAAQTTRLHRVHDRGATDHPRERESAGERLGHRHQIRLDAAVLDGEHSSGATEAALDLIGDQEDAVLITTLTYQLEHLPASPG